jgi:hypothetical protein
MSRGYFLWLTVFTYHNKFRPTDLTDEFQFVSHLQCHLDRSAWTPPHVRFVISRSPPLLMLCTNSKCYFFLLAYCSFMSNPSLFPGIHVSSCWSNLQNIHNIFNVCAFMLCVEDAFSIFWVFLILSDVVDMFCAPCSEISSSLSYIYFVVILFLFYSYFFLLRHYLLCTLVSYWGHAVA